MRREYEVYGMSCSACAAAVENAVRRVTGVSSATVSLLTNSMVVEYDAPADDEAVCRAVRRAGYRACPVEPNIPHLAFGDETVFNPDGGVRVFTSLCLSALIFYFAMGHMFGLTMIDPCVNPYLFMGMQLVIAFVAAGINYRYFVGGFLALIRRVPNMDTLVMLGSGAALLHGTVSFILAVIGGGERAVELATGLYLDAAVMILALVTLGKTLEGRAKLRTTEAILLLAKLSPSKVTVRRGGEDMVVYASDLVVGDTVILKTGDRIAADGTVTSGTGCCDESAVTGESRPIDKGEGDVLIAGCLVTDGYLEMRADKVGEDTSLAATIRMIREAAASKAPIARLADRVSTFFVPAVLLIAVATALVWFFVSGPSAAFVHGVSVLVISCPCALGLATPTAIVTATGRGAERGILIKSAAALETLGRVKTVALDKTGTLTRGEMRVITSTVAPGADPDRFRSVAYALESRSTHPIARAIAADLAGIPDLPLSTHSTIPGKGVYGKVDGIHLLGGNAALLEDDMELDLTPLSAAAEAILDVGGTPVFFSEGETLLGVIGVGDTVREDAPEALARLRELGCRSVMLTGDHPRAAAGIAGKVGCDEYRAGLLPDGKTDAVADLSANAGPVLMVGDGINDAPALTSADVGAAVGVGTDVAIASADVVLRSGNVSDVVTSIRLGRAALRNIKQNLFWALFYNAICIPIAAGALSPLGVTLSPWMAALAMSFSSVFVVTNALRLRRFR